MDQQECMKRAAEYAVDNYVHDGMVVGLGTGRTASYAIRRLANLLNTGKLRDVVGIATSEASQRLMSELGIPSCEMKDSITMAVAIDGADAFDDHLNLIKGGGGALFREKLVEIAAEKLVIVVDESKRAKGHLLEAFKLPVEIVKFGHAATVERIVSHFKESIKAWKIRENADGSLYETDNHNFIMDLECAPTELKRLDEKLKSIHGVVCSGLFLGMASAVVVAHRDGSLGILP